MRYGLTVEREGRSRFADQSQSWHGALHADLVTFIHRLQDELIRYQGSDRRVVRAEIDAGPQSKPDRAAAFEQLVRDVDCILPVRKQDTLFEHKPGCLVTPHGQTGLQAELRRGDGAFRAMARQLTRARE